MFYARIEAAGEFRKILEVLKDITPTINLTINSNGFTIEASETLYVVQVKLKISQTYFSEFKVTNTHTLGLHLPDLITLIKLGQPEDHLILSYNSGTSILNINLQACKTPTVCEFTLNLLQVDSQDCLYVEVSGTGKFVMSAKALHSTFHDLSLVSEFLLINLNKMRVKFRVSADEAGGSVNLKHVRGESGVLISTSRTFNVEINLVYAKKITKAHQLCDKVEVRVYDGEPVVFCYLFEGVELKFCLAPTISDRINI